MAQLNDLLVMGQSTLLGPVKIDSIIDKDGSNGATNSSTIDKVLKSDDNGKVYWGSADNVTFSQTLTSGTKIGTITINGTGTDLYCQTNTNTTYTFANGTNGFTVTPAGGNAQTVTVTPSITNNITGSGTRTSGYIAKFSGANTITNGPAIGTSTTTYLRNDGTWATPPNTTYSNFVKSGTGAKAGLVPAPSTTAGTTKYLREDGTWQVPPDTNTHVNNSAWSSIELNANDSTKLANYGGFIDFHYRNGSGTLEQPADYTSRIIEDANGSLSLNGVKCFSGGTLQFNKLKLPTSSNGSSYGLGSSGQVLQSNGSTVYWGTPTSAIVCTKAEFNALTSYQTGVLYCITDS